MGVALALRWDSPGNVRYVTGEPLKSVRVIVGQGLALFTGIEVALWNGADGLQFLLPLWGAVVGAAIYRQMKPIQRIKSF